MVTEIIKSISDAPPTHYMVKIESFSLLTKHAIERYETESFEAGGYKWYDIIISQLYCSSLFKY